LLNGDVEPEPEEILEIDGIILRFGIILPNLIQSENLPQGWIDPLPELFIGGVVFLGIG
jgi:hypothetical protein